MIKSRNKFNNDPETFAFTVTTSREEREPSITLLVLQLLPSKGRAADWGQRSDQTLRAGWTLVPPPPRSQAVLTTAWLFYWQQLGVLTPLVYKPRPACSPPRLNSSPGGSAGLQIIPF